MKHLLVLLLFVVSVVFSLGAGAYIVLADEDSVIEAVKDQDELRAGMKTTKFEQAGINWEAGATITYDSNPFIYSHDDIDEYDSGTNPTRFKGVDSIDDVITNLFLIMRTEKDIVDLGPTTFSLGAEANIYGQNSDRSYGILSTSIKQEIDEDNLVRIGYDFMPNYFIRTLYDRDLTASALADRFRKVEFSSHSVHVKYWRRIMDDLTCWLRYTYENKAYNPYFEERDTDSHRLTLAAGFTPESWVKFNPFFRYFWHNAEGEDLDADVDEDISRDGFDIGLNTEFYPEGKFSYLIGYAFRGTDYNTSNSVADDPYHTGREQERHRITGRVNYEWKDDLDLFAEYEYEVRGVEVAGSDVNLIYESILGYVKHIIRTGLKATF